LTVEKPDILDEILPVEKKPVEAKPKVKTKLIKDPKTLEQVNSNYDIALQGINKVQTKTQYISQSEINKMYDSLRRAYFNDLKKIMPSESEVYKRALAGEIPVSVKPKPTAKVAKPKAKEPWEMTKKEYGETVKPSLKTEKIAREYDTEWGKRKRAQKLEAQKYLRIKWREEGLSEKDIREKLRKHKAYDEHVLIVEKAVSENKPVPAEVLADYPDLKPKAPAVKTETPKIIDNRPNLKKGASVEYKSAKTGKIISGKIIGERPFDERILVRNQHGIQRIMNVKDLRAAGTPVEDFVRPPSYREGDYLTTKRPLAKTPKQAVAEIIEGKAESNLGMKEFKKQMLAELDRSINKAEPGLKKAFTENPKDFENVLIDENIPKITIKIPRDGEFTIDNKIGALSAIRKKVNSLSEIKSVFGTEGKPRKSPYYYKTKKYKTIGGKTVKIPEEAPKIKAPTLKDSPANPAQW